MTATMPAPPNRMVWELKIDTLADNATLWLYKRSRITGRSSGWSIICASVCTHTYKRLNIERASIDEIVEAVVTAADGLIKLVEAEPAQRAAAESKQRDLESRLGIKVVTKR